MRFLVKGNVWAVLNDILWLNSFRHVYNKNRLEMIQYKYFSNAQTDYKSLNKHGSMQKTFDSCLKQQFFEEARNY